MTSSANKVSPAATSASHAPAKAIAGAMVGFFHVPESVSARLGGLTARKGFTSTGDLGLWVGDSDGVVRSDDRVVAAALPGRAARAAAVAEGTGLPDGVAVYESGRLMLSGPMYYSEFGAGLVFADSPAALFDSGVVEPRANDEAVVRFIATGGCDEGDVTFFRDVRRVPAGYALISDGHSTTLQAQGSPSGADQDLVTAVRFGQGIVGAALVAQHPQAAVYHASFGPLDDSEDRYVEQALAELRPGTEETERSTAVPVHADTVSADLDEFIAVLGEPVPDPLAYVQFATVRAAASDGVELLIDPVEASATTGGRKPVNPIDILPAGTVARTGQVIDRASVWRRVADRLVVHYGVAIEMPYVEDDSMTPVVPGQAKRSVGGRREAIALRAILLRLKNRIYELFHTEAFVSRPWFDELVVREAFEGFIKGRNTDAELFWRIMLVELWAQAFLDPKPEAVPPTPIKGPLDPNAGKQLEIDVQDEQWTRVPIRTELFAKGDDVARKISEYVHEIVALAHKQDAYAAALTRPWYLMVSEKVVAIAQGRSYFVWEIEPSWWARTLSKYVVKTPYGIGLGSPWTMQLAIQEAGLPRILAASAVSAAGKLVGKRGLFYHVAGHSVRAIDGPTEYSVYPANVSAKLPPAEPDAVAARVHAAVGDALRAHGLTEIAAALAGCVIIDANDIGRNVLGMNLVASSDKTEKFFEELFADNPLGQGSQQTPLAIAMQLTE